eukprot:gene5575-biopygen4713
MRVDFGRRAFLGAAVAGAVATADWPLVAQVASTGPMGVNRFPLRTVRAGLLEISYAELGPPDGDAVILLHGWPYDIHSFADVAPRLAQEGRRVIIPYLRGFGNTRFLSAGTMRNGQPAAVAFDTIAMMDALGISNAVLAGFDWGARSADVIAALWPNAATVASIIFCTSASLAMSVRMKCATPPACSHSFTVSRPPVSLVSATITRAPSAVSNSAAARPTPLPPPVTMIALPFTFAK